MTDVEHDDVTDGDEGDDGNQELAPTAVAVMEYLAKAVVEDADAVQVEVSSLRGGKKVRISVHAAPNDFGRLIGRRGRVAAALRTVVGAAAAKDGLDAEVEFVE
ncbi:MAG: KH domain-containing protein [Acidimicrobiia bacterium]